MRGLSEIKQANAEAVGQDRAKAAIETAERTFIMGAEHVALQVLAVADRFAAQALPQADGDPGESTPE